MVHNNTMVAYMGTLWYSVWPGFDFVVYTNLDDLYMCAWNVATQPMNHGTQDTSDGGAQCRV